MQKWWEKEAALKFVVDLAFELDEQYPTENLISLGQSPAWAIHGVGMIRKIRGESANTSFIPFTGAFNERDPEVTSDDENEMSFTKTTDAFPDEGRLSKYFNFLKNLNLEPYQVLDKAKMTGNDAVIFDMIISGKGLASFLSVWLRSPEGNAAVSELGKKIKVHTFDVNQSKGRETIRFPCCEEVKIPLIRRVLKKEEGEMMQNISALNCFDKFSDRLVGMFRLAQTSKKSSLEYASNGAVVKEISQAIHNEIQRRMPSQTRVRVNPSMPATKVA